ncbi:MAG: glycosyltransferase family 2 protein [Anaerolineales bacterium]
MAKEWGVQHIVRHSANRGLAAAFRTGLKTSLTCGADIIVNTDADNQYPGQEIPRLVQPILDNQADMVIANRQTDTIVHFSAWKRFLQRFGSQIVRYASGTEVPDAPSGFRAFSREAALRINIFTRYTYTLESIIQMGKKNLNIVHVPVRTNPPTRKSRLVKNNLSYVMRSTNTILRLFLLYEPLRTFTYLSIPFFLTGGVLWLRFGIILLSGEAARGSNVQSVIVGSAALIIGFLIFLIGLIGEMLAVNRFLNEEILYELKRQQLEHLTAPQPDPSQSIRET